MPRTTPTPIGSWTKQPARNFPLHQRTADPGTGSAVLVRAAPSSIVGPRTAMGVARMPHPVVETERLFVREYTVDDAPAAFEIYRDPEVWRYLGGDAAYTTVEQARERIEQRIQRYQERAPYGLWAVVVRDTWQLIGSVLLSPLEDGPEVELGY